MPPSTCRQCGTDIAGDRKPGRTPIYCSPRCRQQAYRTRQSHLADQSAERLIAQIQQQAGRLRPQPPITLDATVRELAASLRRLRRVARDVAPVGLPHNVTADHVVPAPPPDDTEARFAAQAERFRPWLRVHCYRMLGSFDEAVDQVQETFLHAWQSRDELAGPGKLSRGLIAIATQACLDLLHRQPRSPKPHAAIPGAPTDVSWLQPFPDLMLDAGADPDTKTTVDHSTVGLPFVAALQHLSPRQRAILLTRDVLGWPANETAALLDTTVPATNRALTRARAAVRHRTPPPADPPQVAPGPGELAILERYMAATDLDSLAALLHDDVTVTAPPNRVWCTGRDNALELLRPVYDPSATGYVGQWRRLATAANRQPAAAGYVQRPGTTVYRAQALDVLSIVDERIVEITTFEPHLFAAFGLPPTL